MTDHKTVPVEPTEEMIVAMMEADLLGRPSVDDPAHVTGIYKAMLAAAPPTDPWQPIETAPRDGTEVYAGTLADGPVIKFVPYPVTSRFLDGKWCAYFGPMLEWGPYDPQPDVWRPKTTGQPITQPTELDRLAMEIADAAAWELIDCESVLTVPGGWMDTSACSDDVEMGAEIRYLELRGLLEHHPERPELVRLREGSGS